MITTLVLLKLSLIFFLIATVYAAVGFGGGSSYLAMLSLYLKDFLAIKTTGLLCNLVVVSNGSYLFRKNGWFDGRRFLPVVLGGVPMAFYGATIRLQQTIFFIVLGSVLMASGVLLLLQHVLRPSETSTYRKTYAIADGLLGAGVGFLSGLVGIGGGILLSPVLNLMRWDSPKRIAALASFFILVNSIAGLLGQLAGGHFNIQMPLVGVLLVAVFLGGQLGTRISLKAIRPGVIKGLTGVLVGYIGVKLVLKHTIGIDI
ncbi:MAG: sulfite exporter TauE/SafE family protein [Sphingobacteriales bacterium]|nr:MAG: sulfite exporter TauE/SafE family protein [Sphingobacteriales bacterium]